MKISYCPRTSLQFLKRLKNLKGSSTVGKKTSSISSNKNEGQNLSKYVMPTLTTLTIFLLFKYLGEK